MTNKDNSENVIQPVLNFDFKTLMLFRCTKRIYAEQLQNGKIFFGAPRNWVQMELDGNVGQGDILEGTFFSAIENDKSSFVRSMKENDSFEYFNKNGFVFFRRKGILDLRCLCLYGLRDNSFSKTIDENGQAHYQSSITKRYFSDFTDYKTRDEYDKAEKADQPVVVFVYNPYEFFGRIRSALMSLGVREEEIIISPVEYLNRYEPMTTNIPYPGELLLKDKSFENQSEVRIIINSNNPQYISYMQRNNNILSIGSLADITQIYDYYFNDLSLERMGNTGLMFSLPQSKTFSIYDMSFFELENLLHNILRGTVKIKGLKEECLTWDERLKIIIDLFKSKFGVIVHIEENKKIYMYNMSQELLEQSNKKYKNDIERDKLCKQLNNLIETGKLEDALSICLSNYDNKYKKGVAYFYSGKIYKIRGEMQKAIEYFNKSYMNDNMTIESLDGIASIYVQLGDYNKAIEVYNTIQDEKGYDSFIWCDIGVCYIHLQQYDKAIEYFDKGIERMPSDAYAYYNKGVALYKKGDHKCAKECMEKAMKLDPDNLYYKMEYRKAYGINENIVKP